MFQDVFNNLKSALFNSNSETRANAGKESAEDLLPAKRVRSMSLVDRTTVTVAGQPTTWDKNGEQRQKGISEVVRAVTFYWGSLLSDPRQLKTALTENADCVLIDIHDTFESFHLYYRDEKLVLQKKMVTYHRKNLMIADNSKQLLDFIRDSKLKPVNRPTQIDAKAISSAVPQRLAHPFAMHPQLVLLGMLRPVTMSLGARRQLNVMAIEVSELKNVEKDRLLVNIQDRKHFGNERFWRFLALSPPQVGPTLTIYMEDIVYGSVSEFLRTRTDSSEGNKVLDFAYETADGLRYLEKYDFVHKKLSIDCLLLTYELKVKIAIYGLTVGEMFPSKADFEEMDRCRWAPPECLPATRENGLTPHVYDNTAMVYTYGTMVWSMFNQGAVPYETELPEEVRSISYRKENPLEIFEGLMTEEVEVIIRNCWNHEREMRPRFKEIKTEMKKLR